MPPKKMNASSKAGAASTFVDEDLSDAASLPALNEFIFTNFYAFKYRKNRDRIEQQLMAQFYKAPEGETAVSPKLL